MWAIGVITYFLLCGYTPFDRDTNAEEMQAIVNGEYDFEPEEYWSEVTDNGAIPNIFLSERKCVNIHIRLAKEFIRECLNKDFEKRITAEQCLRHPFLLQSQGKEDETNLLPSLKTNLLQRKYSTTDGMQNKPLKRLAEETIMDGKFSESPEAIRSPASNTSPTDQIPPLLA